MAGAESGRTEQIIGNFFLKVLQVVLDTRVPHLLAGSRVGGDKARKRDRWFNLALGDPPAALESLGFWHRSVTDPMVVDVLLLRDAAEAESVLERWTVHYEPSPSSSSSRPSTPSSPFRAFPAASSSGDAAAVFYNRTYKKCIILLRSIYAILRLLPAYKPFRTLSAATLKNIQPHRHHQNQNCNFNLSYRVSSFAEPFTRAEEDEMKHYDFAAVETQFGQITVSAIYRHDLSEFNLESSSLFPPRIIADYVGSPGAGSSRTLPSSLPWCEGFVLPASSPAKGIIRSGSSPISRPHSWTSTPMAHHPLSISPQTASEMQNSPVGIFGQRIAGGHHHLSSSRKGSTSFNEYPFSPPFSPSPSPSPPTRSASHLHRRLQSETAPVTIPSPATGSNPVHPRNIPNLSDPSRISLPPPSPRISRADNSSEDSPEIRSFRRVEGFKLSEISPALQKGMRDGRDDSGRFSGVLSSCGGSPRVGFSRSSSKLSFQDDLDDSCPFAVDDLDDSQRRAAEGKVGPENQPASSSVSSWTSQEAAVGILVHMLRTAPPLRQEQGGVDQSVDQSGDLGGGGASSFYAARRAADALEELRSYKQIKDMLISRSGSQSTGPTRRER